MVGSRLPSQALPRAASKPARDPSLPPWASPASAHFLAEAFPACGSDGAWRLSPGSPSPSLPGLSRPAATSFFPAGWANSWPLPRVGCLFRTFALGRPGSPRRRAAGIGTRRPRNPPGLFLEDAEGPGRFLAPQALVRCQEGAMTAAAAPGGPAGGRSERLRAGCG